MPNIMYLYTPTHCKSFYNRIKKSIMQEKEFLAHHKTKARPVIKICYDLRIIQDIAM